MAHQATTPEGAPAGVARDGAASAAPGSCADIGKLRWRCRRGLKELDVLLERYMDERFHSASPLEQEAFRQLLKAEDRVIYAYCLREEPPPQRFADLIRRITTI
jgi:antitoxin CptB